MELAKKKKKKKQRGKSVLQAQFTLSNSVECVRDEFPRGLPVPHYETGWRDAFAVLIRTQVRA